jgi:hypothetical protein
MQTIQVKAIKHPEYKLKVTVSDRYDIYAGNTLLGRIWASDWESAHSEAVKLFPVRKRLSARSAKQA